MERGREKKYDGSLRDIAKHAFGDEHGLALSALVPLGRTSCPLTSPKQTPPRPATALTLFWTAAWLKTSLVGVRHAHEPRFHEEEVKA